jgi:hypothetical protein
MSGKLTPDRTFKRVAFKTKRTRVMRDRDISPENLQRLLRASQRELDEQLASIILQIQRQAESTFGGKTWAEASWQEFSQRLITHGKALIEQGERMNLSAINP